MTKEEYKIGDIVELNVTNEIIGNGAILGQAFDHALVKGWIVLLLRRDSEFLKNRPEKAIIVIESQMRKV